MGTRQGMRRIAFVSDRTDLTPLPGNPDQLPQKFVLDRSCGAIIQVSESTFETQNIDALAMSADGRRVVWVENSTQVKMSDVSAGPDMVVGAGFAPTMNADGTLVAFVRDVGDTLELFDTDTGSRTVALVADRGFGFPTLSADGRRIAFTSSSDLNSANPDLDVEVFLLDLASGGVVQLTSGTGYFGMSPLGITADGSRVVFNDERELVGPNPDGRGEIYLASCGAAPTLVYEFSGFQPPLLPDGSAVIRQSNEGRVLPVKFRLSRDGQPIGTAVATIAVHKVLDVATGSVDTTDLTADAGNANDNGPLFRVDPETLQYIYNLSTRGFEAPATYRIRVTLDDGGVYTVNFSLR
jgi:Tol biopolymer transport system component